MDRMRPIVLLFEGDPQRASILTPPEAETSIISRTGNARQAVSIENQTDTLTGKRVFDSAGLLIKAIADTFPDAVVVHVKDSPDLLNIQLVFEAAGSLRKGKTLRLLGEAFLNNSICIEAICASDWDKICQDPGFTSRGFFNTRFEPEDYIFVAVEGAQEKHIRPNLPSNRISLAFDVVNACNLRCRKCGTYNPNSIEYTQNSGNPMSVEQITRRLSEVEKYFTEKYATFSNRGEPLLHADILNIVRTAVQKDFTVSLTTNGLLLDKKKSKALLKAGLSNVMFSVDGFTKDVYERLHKGGCYPMLVRNLEDFLNIRDQLGSGCRVSMNFVNYGDANAHQFDRYVDFWLPKVDTIIESALIDMEQAGVNRCFFLNRFNLMRVPCLYPLFPSLNFDHTLHVTQCCGAYRQKPLAGPQSPLLEVLNGRSYGHIQASQRTGHFEQWPYCLDCDAWLGSFQGIEYDFGSHRIVRHPTQNQIMN